MSGNYFGRVGKRPSEYMGDIELTIPPIVIISWMIHVQVVKLKFHTFRMNNVWDIQEWQMYI